MKSLLVLRHAEAMAEAPGVSDLNRPLTGRGRTQARAVGMWLHSRRTNPDRILCSTAVRARETAEIVTATAAWTVSVTAVDELYNAPAVELLTQAQRLDAETQLLLVAHAPGVADLVSWLTTKQDDVTLRYEAATLAEVVLDIDRWSEIDCGTGVLGLLLPP